MANVLPVPLRDIVVFPRMVAPLFVGRDKSVRALEEVEKGGGYRSNSRKIPPIRANVNLGDQSFMASFFSFIPIFVGGEPPQFSFSGIVVPSGTKVRSSIELFLLILEL